MIATGRVFLLAYWRPAGAPAGGAAAEPLAAGLCRCRPGGALSILIGLFPKPC